MQERCRPRGETRKTLMRGEVVAAGVAKKEEDFCERKRGGPRVRDSLESVVVVVVEDDESD